MTTPPIHAVVPSPVGDLLLTSDGDALTGLYLTPHKGGPIVEPHWRRDSSIMRVTRHQLAAYFAGELRDFDVPLAPRGTPFQLRVWRGLQQIPYGQTWTYGQLARHLGAPGAARAVGLANGRNPISIVVPCHRVIGADGNLTGYGGGLDRKRQLLEHERAAVGAQPSRLF